MPITIITMPDSTCQNKMLSGKDIGSPKFTLIISRIPRIEESIKLINRIQFHIIMWVMRVKILSLNNVNVIMYSIIKTIEIGIK